MKKKTIYTCQACGYQSPKWLGRCPDCREWESFVEELKDPKVSDAQGAFGAIHASGPQRLSEVEGAELSRVSSGIGELDRVLGGGLVKGAHRQRRRPRGRSSRLSRRLRWACSACATRSTASPPSTARSPTRPPPMRTVVAHGTCAPVARSCRHVLCARIL